MKRPLKLLVVDDNRDAVLTLGILFRSEGVEVEMLRDGESALAKVSRFGPDVVLLDILMPGRDGFEIAEELRACLGATCPVLVAVTALDGPEDKTKARLSGFDHHVSKPYDPLELLEFVTALGYHKRQTAAIR
jgi:CheY-like chemotaxis protein